MTSGAPAERFRESGARRGNRRKNASSSSAANVARLRGEDRVVDADRRAPTIRRRTRAPARGAGPGLTAASVTVTLARTASSVTAPVSASVPLGMSIARTGPSRRSSARARWRYAGGSGRRAPVPNRPSTPMAPASAGEPRARLREARDASRRLPRRARRSAAARASEACGASSARRCSRMRGQFGQRGKGIAAVVARARERDDAAIPGAIARTRSAMRMPACA